MSLLQANGQAAFFVALFRKETRDMIMQWLQWALPTSIPFLKLRQTPAHFLQSFVHNGIQRFQDGVDRRAAAQQSDPRYAGSALCLSHAVCLVILDLGLSTMHAPLAHPRSRSRRHVCHMVSA